MREGRLAAEQIDLHNDLDNDLHNDLHNDLDNDLHAVFTISAGVATAMAATPTCAKLLKPVCFAVSHWTSDSTIKYMNTCRETMCVITVNHRNVESFPSHRAHTAALISVSLALSQTPVYTVRPRIRGQCIARCACLCPSFRWYSLRLPTEGWPGWVDLGGWLHTEMVHPPADGHPPTY